MTTEQCLLHPNRNPGMSRADLERALRDFLGVSEVLWLGEGVAGDDTDGHIDDIARFVVAADDRLRGRGRSGRSQLRAAAGQPAPPRAGARSGRPAAIRWSSCRCPGRILADGEPLPASYANFYIANDVVLLPVYEHPNDAQAIDTLSRLFPDRRVVPIACENLVWGMGAIHCVTQQQPKVRGLARRRPRLGRQLRACAMRAAWHTIRPMQVIKSPKVYDVAHRRLGGRRRHRRQGADRSRRRRRDARGRADVGLGQGQQDVRLELRLAEPRLGRRQEAVRRVRRLHRRLGDRGRALHGRHRRLALVPRPHARRPHQPLGPHLAALRPRRLPRQDASTASATTGRSPTTT